MFIADVRSIKINPSQNVIALNFTTTNDFTNGISLLQNSHLEVISTSGYLIKVRTSSANLVNAANKIPVNTITLTPALNISSGATTSSASQSGSSTQSSIYSFPVILAPNPKLMVESSIGASRTIFNVSYTASGGQEYMNKATGNYTTTITYSIEPN